MTTHVYILRSQSDSQRIYIGFTRNLDERLITHSNPDSTAYTRRFAPWKLETYITFSDDKLAQDFEVYLKSHAGRAFLRKRLIKE